MHLLCSGMVGFGLRHNLGTLLPLQPSEGEKGGKGALFQLSQYFAVNQYQPYHNTKKAYRTNFAFDNIHFSINSSSTISSSILSTTWRGGLYFVDIYLTPCSADPISLYLHVNVSDQTSIFTHETKMLSLICWKCFLAFNVLNMTRTDGWIQKLMKKETNVKNRPKFK